MVTLFEESVAAPDEDTVVEEVASPTKGPAPDGHTACTVGERHNCGASPTAFTSAVAEATVPDDSTKSTKKEGLEPVVAGRRVEMLTSAPAVICTRFQSAITPPAESLIER